MNEFTLLYEYIIRLVLYVGSDYLKLCSARKRIRILSGSFSPSPHFLHTIMAINDEIM
jgi:hypothetical protein